MAKRRMHFVSSKMKKSAFPIQLTDDSSALTFINTTALSSSGISRNNDSRDKSFKNSEILDQTANSSELSSLCMCSYCDFTANTNQELDIHIRQHNMIKCFLCAFVSFSKSQLTRHMKHKHRDLLITHNSINNLDKDPCTTCLYCDFLTYSTELLEKHTTALHQNISLISFGQRMISRPASAMVRESDALFYSTLLLEENDSETSDGEVNEYNCEPPSASTINDNEEDHNSDTVNDFSKLPANEKLLKSDPYSDVKHDSVSTELFDNTTSEASCDLSTQESPYHASSLLNVKKEAMYCLSCQYSDFTLDKLKHHIFTQHPTRAAVVGNSPREAADNAESLSDITFFCIKDTCPYSTAVCSAYEEHLMNCPSLQQRLSKYEKERLKTSLKCVLDFHQKYSLEATSGFLDFVSSINKPCLSVHDHKIQKEDKEHSYSVSREESGMKIQDKCNLQDCAEDCDGGGHGKCLTDSFGDDDRVKGDDLEHHMQKHHDSELSEVVQINKGHSELLKNSHENDTAMILKSSVCNENFEENLSGSSPRQNVHSCQSCGINLYDRNSLEHHMKNQHSDGHFKIMHGNGVQVTTDSQEHCIGAISAISVNKSEHDNDVDSNFIKSNNTDTSILNCNENSHDVQQNRAETCMKKPKQKPLSWKELCNSGLITGSSGKSGPLHRDVHIEKRTFTCDVCGKNFGQQDSLNNHISKHTEEKLFVCKVCGKKFRVQKSLTYHMTIHTGEKPYQCHECGKRVTVSHQLKLHMRIHTGERPYSCSKCDKTYQSLSGLRKHEFAHTGEKPFNCSLCDKNFSDRSNLKKHMAIHTGERPFQCNECGKRFSAKYKLIQHVRIHTGEKPYECHVCGKRFVERTNLQTHIRTHTGEKPFKCEVCGKTFTQSSALRIHTRYHTGERPYMCTLCGQQFASNSHLNVHMRTHQGLKPFTCNVCHKSFREGTFLKKHMFTHTKEKPFQCSICGSCFNRKSNLNTHMKTHMKKST